MREAEDARAAAPAADGLIASRDGVSRIDTLLRFIAAQPGDPFPRYGLAQEYKNAGRLDEARAEFDALMRDASRLHGGVPARGQRAVALGERDEARAIYRARRRGLRRRGDGHATASSKARCRRSATDRVRNAERMFRVVCQALPLGTSPYGRFAGLRRAGACTQ